MFWQIFFAFTLLWQYYGLSRFQRRDTILDTCLAKKIIVLYFVNWNGSKTSNIGYFQPYIIKIWKYPWFGLFDGNPQRCFPSRFPASLWKAACFIIDKPHCVFSPHNFITKYFKKYYNLWNILGRIILCTFNTLWIGNSYYLCIPQPCTV